MLCGILGNVGRIGEDPDLEEYKIRFGFGKKMERIKANFSGFSFIEKTKVNGQQSLNGFNFNFLTPDPYDQSLRANWPSTAFDSNKSSVLRAT